MLLGEVTRHAAIKHDAEGRSVTQRFREEQVSLRALPAVAFNARHTRLVTVSRQATVSVEGATYSVPSRWARLEATAHIGVEDLLVTCRGEAESHPQQPTGGKSVRYRHYLPELAHKPQAVRQVAPELVAELGEPYGRLWQLLVAAHGGLEAGRVLARVLAAIGAHGEETITAVLAAVLAQAGTKTADIPEQMPLKRNVVPTGLRFYEVEEGRAADYDWLLAEPTPMLSQPMMRGGGR